MAMNIPNIVRPEEGWGMNAAKNANALTRQDLENQYYAPLQQADINLKNTQARFMQPTLLAQVMASPAFATLDDNVKRTIGTLYANSLTNPPPMNQSIPSNQSGSGINNLFNTVWNELIRNTSDNSQQQPINPFAQQPQSQPQGRPQSNASSGYSYDANGNNIVASPKEVENVANNGNNQYLGGASATPAAQSNTQNLNPGANPQTTVSSSQAAQKANETGVVGQQQNQNEQQKARSLQLSNQATISTSALKSLEGFHRNYGKANYTGQYFGSHPSSGTGSLPTVPGQSASPDQLADSYKNELLLQLSALGNTPAGQTDAGRELISSAKIDRSFDQDAEKEKYESTKAGLQRMIILRDFATDFYKNNPNATDEQLVGLMNAYNEYAPYYDYEKGKSLPNNDKKFREFTSPQALKSYIDNGSYIPPKKNPVPTFKLKPGKTVYSVAEVEGREPPVGTIWMETPEGGRSAVHTENVDYVTKKYGFKKVE